MRYTLRLPDKYDLLHADFIFRRNMSFSWALLLYRLSFHVCWLRARNIDGDDRYLNMASVHSTRVNKIQLSQSAPYFARLMARSRNIDFTCSAFLSVIMPILKYDGAFYFLDVKIHLSSKSDCRNVADATKSRHCIIYARYFARPLHGPPKQAVAMTSGNNKTSDYLSRTHECSIALIA